MKITNMHFKNAFLILPLFAIAMTLSNCGPKSADQETAEQPTAAAFDSTVTTGIAEIGDSKIEYFIQGKGSTVILLPDAGLNSDYLKGLSLELARNGYQVVRINPRGTGQSTGREAGINMHNLADDVGEAIRKLQLGIVDIAGHGFGNQVARMVANDNPALVRSVTLIGLGGSVPGLPEAKAAYDIALSTSSESEGMKAMEYMVGNIVDAEATWIAIKASRTPEVGKSQAAALKATPADEWAKPIGSAQLLVIQGSVDRVTPPDNGKNLQKEIGDYRVKLASIPGAGHMMVVTRYKEVADAMVAFLKKQK